ncbi:MAG: heme-binding protein, partial [Gammaproteobacteria bacterium]
TDTTGGNCSGGCAVAAGAFLSVADVEQIIAQAVGEARAQGVNATIAVVDRVGNVLAVFRMGAQSILIASATDSSGAAVVAGGLEGLLLPTVVAPLPLDDQAAITKAITGAYLSSEGNGFSTRTASQIVQEHFNPGEDNQPAGPLFGVQFSQLACSDFTLADTGSADVGPKRSPLGLSADPGGFPLYEAGTVVGGVGVISDGRYGLDAVISDTDKSIDELIALAASFGFGTPVDRRADRITADGKTFRFADADFSDLASDPAAAAPFASLTPADGDLVTVVGYTDGLVEAGTIFGTPASGIRPDNDVDFPNQDAFVFVDNANLLRFAPIAGTDGGLNANEVRSILSEALAIAERARAQIRRPLGDIARVTISVVDTNGVVLGMVRSRDAPVFGADVSVQKARTASLFSSAEAAAFLSSLPDTKYIEVRDDFAGAVDSVAMADYVAAVRSFLGEPTALADGAFAFSDRAGGNLSRPFYPDGIETGPPGPFSKPPGFWSPFSTGLQLDLVLNAVLQHVLYVAAGGLGLPDVGDNCAGVDLADNLTSAVADPTTPLFAANGIQIFPGSVPIYRDNMLLGGIGVSGDGVDQDDMVAFLGLHNAGTLLGTVNNAPTNMRADQLTPLGVRLRFIQCPQAPFVDSTEDNVCDGK